MSNYIRWTQHPDTGHWHNAYWIDDHFAPHHYGVKFNDGTIQDPSKKDMPTVETVEEIPEGSIIDNTRDLYAEVFGHKQMPKQEDTILDVWITELNEIRKDFRAYGQYTAIGKLKLKRMSKEIKEELEQING